jgi:hypothetical protein
MQWFEISLSGYGPEASDHTSRSTGSTAVRLACDYEGAAGVNWGHSVGTGSRLRWIRQRAVDRSSKLAIVLTIVLSQPDGVYVVAPSSLTPSSMRTAAR